MPAAVGTAFNWVFVRSGVWTKIWQGPLVTGIPFQALELAATSFAGRRITWTLDGFSVSPPFFQRNAGVSTVPVSASQPVGHFSSWAGVFSYAVSPWAEFNLLTNNNCWAHIALL